MNNQTTTEGKEELRKAVESKLYDVFGFVSSDTDGFNDVLEVVYDYIAKEKKAVLEVTDQTITRLRLVAHQLAITQRDIKAIEIIDSIIEKYEQLAHSQEDREEK